MNASPAWQIPISVVNSEKHQQLALKIAQESMVLLQNNNQILPLKSNQKIALMGPNANDSVMQWGNYNGFPAHTVTLLEAMKKMVPAAQLIYEPGCDRTQDMAVKSLFHECAINGKNGFQAQYWNTRTPEGEPVVTDVLATPFHLTTTGATAFAAGVNIRDFSARYKTVFNPTKSGEVAFQFQNMGRATLTINGELVVRNIFAATPNIVHKMEVEAGKSYEIEINFSAGNFDASLNFDFGTLVPFDLSASIEKVKDADIVVFAGGIAPSLEGEEMRVTVPGFKGGDRTDIELPAIQRRMLQALKTAGKKVVFVNFSGSAMGFVPETQSCEAILQAWYPGQAGGTAIANVLFGQYNPSGKLPVTFYKNVEQIPDFENYSMRGRTYRFMTEKPLFPFGFGLSYTTFNIGEAKVFNAEAEPDENVELAVPVTNAGKTDGTETIQIYVRKTGDTDGPLKTLKAFQRIAVAAGKTEKAEISLPYNSFEFFNRESGKMAVIPGEYEVYYGSSSDEKDLKKAKVVLQ
jgi:beta-glucosidase